MKTSSTTNSPSFGWGIDVRYRKQGNVVTKITEYKPDTGKMLIRMDEYKNGKLLCTLKELYSRKMHLLKRKFTAYDEQGKKVPGEWFA